MGSLSILSAIGSASLGLLAFCYPAHGTPYSATQQKFQYSFRDLLPVTALASEAAAVNASGQVIGWITEANHVTRACVWINGLPRFLSLPDGGQTGRATKINASGQIIGSADFSMGDGTFQKRACTWTGPNFAPVELPAVQGEPWINPPVEPPGAQAAVSQANDLNNAGQVVGFANGRACVWTNLVGASLEARLGSTTSEARAINASGVIAGDYNFSLQPHACIWTGGALTDIVLPSGAVASSAIDINDAGQVLVWWRDDQHIAHLSRWENGTHTEIFPSGLGPTGAEKNAKLLPDGSVVGQVALSGTSYNRAFVWKNGVVTMLRLHGGTVSNAVAMSASGRAVGSRTGTTGKVQDIRLWPGGNSFYNLNPSGAVRGYATDINDAETIVGAFEDRKGKMHAFVLEPGGSPKIVCNGLNIWTKRTGGSRNVTFNRDVRKYTVTGDVVVLQGMLYGTAREIRYRVDGGPWISARHLGTSAVWATRNTRVTSGRHVFTVVARGREGQSRPVKFTVVRR